MARKINAQRISLISAISAAALAVACGSEQESPPDADDAGMSSCTGGSSDTGGSSTGGSSTGGASTGGNSTGGNSTGGWAGSGGSGAVCNTLANIGEDVHHMADPAPVPEMTGGPIANGTYVLTSLVHYDGVSASLTSTLKQTMLITEDGRTAQQVASYDGGPDMHWTIARAPSGNELNAREVCPEETSPNPSPYTATPDSLTIFVEQDETNLVVTFTRPECIGPAEGHFCAPDGFPFVQRAFATSETCPGDDCHPPNPTLTLPESGTLCMSGTAPPDGHALRFLLFVDNQGGSEVLDVFDADALGITQVSFTLDSPPASGITVDATTIAPRDCRGPLFNCLAFGFTGPRITEPGTTTLPLADFLQIEAGNPNQTFDTSSIGGIAFLIGEGAYDFCVRDFKFLDDAGDEVTP